MANYLTNDTELTSVANAIRTKGGTSSVLTYPAGFVSAIEDISTGTDVSDTTASAGDVLSGKYFYTSAGIKTQGNIATKSSSDLTASGKTVTVPAGYYSAQATKNVETGTEGTPTATKGTVSNNSISVTPNVTNTAGYITGGSKTGTAVTVSASELVSGTLDMTTDGISDATKYASVNVTAQKTFIETNYTTYSNSTITKIASGKFAWQASLTMVSLPSCTSFYIGAFYSCSKLSSFYAPLLKYIGSSAFCFCSSLTTVTLPSCIQIYGYAFYSCSQLSLISCPVCTTIGNFAFKTCSNLTTASFPSLKTVGVNAFGECKSLTTLSLPVCSDIRNSAFSSCWRLVSLYLKSSSVVSLQNSNAFTSTPIGGYSAIAGAYGKIYVPSSLLASYKAATNWTYFSARMVGQ